MNQHFLAVQISFGCHPIKPQEQALLVSSQIPFTGLVTHLPAAVGIGCQRLTDAPSPENCPQQEPSAWRLFPFQYFHLMFDWHRGVKIWSSYLKWRPTPWFSVHVAEPPPWDQAKSRLSLSPCSCLFPLPSPSFSWRVPFQYVMCTWCPGLSHASREPKQDTPLLIFFVVILCFF